MSWTPLDLLPYDPWAQVLEYLPQEDLDSLSRTGRDFTIITIPYLYRSFHWDWKHPPLRKIVMLLRSISERPELASHVRHLSFVSWEYNLAHKYFEQNTVQIPTTYAQWPQLRPHVQPTLRWACDIVLDAHFDRKLASWLYMQLLRGDAYTWATILLSQLHNLRSLRLDFSFACMGGLPGVCHSLFGNAPLGVLTKFMKLEKVDYASNVPLSLSNYRNDRAEGYQFMPWYYLPSLKSLENWLQNAWGVCPSPLGLEPVERPPSPSLDLSKLRTLVIMRSTLQCNHTAKLLSGVPYLRSLHIGVIFSHWRTINWFLRAYRGLLNALGTSSETLELLSISFELLASYAFSWLSAESADPIEHESAQNDLIKFRNLKVLSLPLQFISNWEMTGLSICALPENLPENLEHIDLRSDLWDPRVYSVYEDVAVNTLGALIRQRRFGDYQRLRTLSYEGLSNPELELFVKRRMLHHLSLQAGVEVFVRCPNCVPGFITRMAGFVDNVPVACWAALALRSHW
ncbi:hypothetical protein N7535_005297 [Penicillium sp. DV-2018c]|nr:hypothetical protein N7461_008877 [Penicillium sp. DV-2018c]KAJ5571637.1 hypothetical protein N7535_005297 [Penicillium sp. DV-2018c]